jgi:hypothetical protein
MKILELLIMKRKREKKSLLTRRKQELMRKRKCLLSLRSNLHPKKRLRL